VDEMSRCGCDDLSERQTIFYVFLFVIILLQLVFFVGGVFMGADGHRCNNFTKRYHYVFPTHALGCVLVKWLQEDVK
jgi:hypothetical protein